MSAFDEFFTSVREVFARNRDVDWQLTGLILAAAVLVVVGLSVGLRRWRSNRLVQGEIQTVADAGGLDEADLDFLRQVAGAGGMPLREVMTNLASFEHATAAALTAHQPVLRPQSGSEFEWVQRLRKGLGFSSLPAHLWLLTTRELALGDPVTLGGVAGRVVALNEACFAVDLPAAVIPAVGASVALTVDRPEDARYLGRVRLLAVESTPGVAGEVATGPALRRAFFAHDEQPDRQQQREHVRVRVQGAVTVRIVDPGPGPGAGRVTGTLVDVSAGGLSLDLPGSPGPPLRRGARIRCSFILGESQAFEDLGALVVAATAGPVPGGQHLRVSFNALAPAKRDALAAAVATQQRSQAHVAHATGRS